MASLPKTLLFVLVVYISQFESNHSLFFYLNFVLSFNFFIILFYIINYYYFFWICLGGKIIIVFFSHESQSFLLIIPIYLLITCLFHSSTCCPFGLVFFLLNLWSLFSLSNCSLYFSIKISAFEPDKRHPYTLQYSHILIIYILYFIPFWRLARSYLLLEAKVSWITLSFSLPIFVFTQKIWFLWKDIDAEAVEKMIKIIS